MLIVSCVHVVYAKGQDGRCRAELPAAHEV
jgi:hypothetical protein